MPQYEDFALQFFGLVGFEDFDDAGVVGDEGFGFVDDGEFAATEFGAEFVVVRGAVFVVII